jgi:hypothetical protein
MARAPFRTNTSSPDSGESGTKNPKVNEPKNQRKAKNASRQNAKARVGAARLPLVICAFELSLFFGFFDRWVFPR